jgi:hypothetical protein
MWRRSELIYSIETGVTYLETTHGLGEVAHDI